ncbi:MAG: CoA-binding protein [Solirubrobacterales bacterium]
MDLGRLLAPRSIAVLGATDRPDAYGDTILRNLERIGFDGDLWGINPGRDAVRDVACVPSIADLPEPVDALAVAIPAPGVPAAIEAAARMGCGGAVVVSAGFGEVEEGRELEAELRRAALGAPDAPDTPAPRTPQTPRRRVPRLRSQRQRHRQRP